MKYINVVSADDYKCINTTYFLFPAFSILHLNENVNNAILASFKQEGVLLP